MFSAEGGNARKPCLALPISTGASLRSACRPSAAYPAQQTKLTAMQGATPKISNRRMIGGLSLDNPSARHQLQCKSERDRSAFVTTEETMVSTNSEQMSLYPNVSPRRMRAR